MNGKVWVYSGLLILVLALMGFGIWFVLSPEDKIEIPEGDPMILMDINNPEAGILSQLSVYEDGTVIHVEDSGLEMPFQQGDEYVRTWRTGKVNSGDLDYFFSYLDSIDFYEIEYAFIRPGVIEETIPPEKLMPNEMPKAKGPSFFPGGPDDYIRIYANDGQRENTIEVLCYISTGVDPYNELPSPAEYIYAELADIIMNKSERILVEELTK